MKEVSIVIRSRNDAAYIGQVLERVMAQSFTDFEVLSFDNASTDKTPELIAAYPEVRRFTVPEGAYVPGRVLNQAVAESNGKIIVFNNSDSVPVNSHWLESLIAPLLTQQAQATYARQLARFDAQPWVKLDYKRAFGDRTSATPRPFSETFFSMVSSAATKETLQNFPFDEQMKYSEDVAWAKTLRERGQVITYTPHAMVEHSHNYTPLQVRKRFHGEGYADGQIWGKRPQLISLVKGVAGGTLRDLIWLMQTGTLSQIIPCLRYRFLQKLAYQRGLRDYLQDSRHRTE